MRANTMTGAAVLLAALAAALGWPGSAWAAAVTPPTVTLTAPASGLIAGQGWQIALAATTTNGSPGTVTGVEFFADGWTWDIGPGALAAGQWTCKWDTTYANFGYHALVARVTDSNGLTGTSNAALIQIWFPADGSGDGIVDGLDYGVWMNGYHKPGAQFTRGDYNGDGAVNGLDYGVWQNYYNQCLELSDPFAVTKPDATASPAAVATTNGPVVTLTGSYDATNWYVYASESGATASSGAGGIAFVTFTVGGVDVTSASGAGGANDPGDVSPQFRDYGGTGYQTLLGIYGFNQNTIAVDPAPNQVEYGFAQNPSAPGYVVYGLGLGAVNVVHHGTHGSSATQTHAVPAPFLVAGGKLLSGQVPFFVTSYYGLTAPLPFNANNAGNPVDIPAPIGAANTYNNSGNVRSAATDVHLVGAVGSTPTVAITSPTGTTSANIGSTVPLVATASTPIPGGTIATVKFYDGASQLGSGVFDSITNTWTYAWNTTGATGGNHSLTAQAADNLGAWGFSSPATVIQVVSAVSVAITSPTSTYAATMGSTVNLAATASTTAQGGSIASVQFFDNGSFLGSGADSAASGTWTYAWNTAGAAAGLNNITAAATDTFGAQAILSPPTVVNIGIIYPTVAITSPTSTFTVTPVGTTINFAATASTTAPGGSIASVQFYEDYVLLGSGVYDAASGTWTYAWNSTGATVGQRHGFAARVTDNFGNQVFSWPEIVVYLTPICPTVTLLSPTGTIGVQPLAEVTFVARASTAAPGARIVSVTFGGASGVYDPASDTWTGTWDAPVSQGDHYYNIPAEATDNFGQTGVSSPPAVIHVYPAPPPPTVWITSPTSTYICGRGSVVNFVAGYDNHGTGGSNCGFFDNGTWLGSVTPAESGYTFTYAWNTTNASFGTHYISAQVMGAFGQIGVSGRAIVVVRVPADCNGDGIVDGQDYGIWQIGYQKTGRTFVTGDYNGDGFVDGQDYGIWQTNYNHQVVYPSDDPMAATPADTAPVAVPAMAAAPPVSADSVPRLIGMTPVAGAVVSNVKGVALVFDSDVQANAAAVEISGRAGGKQAFTTSYDAAARTLTLTFDAALAPDVYTVRVIGSFVTGVDGGAALDGASSGTPGSDANFGFTVAAE